MGSPIPMGATYWSQSTSPGSVRSLRPDNTWETRSIDNVPKRFDKINDMIYKGQSEI
jgi:hypothetical protein